MAAQHQLLLAITFFVFLIVGAVIALKTGAWWTVAIAAGVHGLGTAMVYGVAYRMLASEEQTNPGPNRKPLVAGAIVVAIGTTASTILLFTLLSPKPGDVALRSSAMTPGEVLEVAARGGLMQAGPVTERFRDEPYVLAEAVEVMDGEMSWGSANPRSAGTPPWFSRSSASSLQMVN